MVKVKIGLYEATIQDYKWQSDYKPLQNVLNKQVPPDGPSGADPFADLTLAQEMVKIFGGKVVKAIRQSNDHPGRVY